MDRTAGPEHGEPVGGAPGFSIAEVVVALGVLAGVLISVAGLLAFGSRQVGGGRSSSEALAGARHVLEEMASWRFPELPARFPSCDPAALVCRVTASDGEPVAAWDAVIEGRIGGSAVDSKPELEVELTVLDGPDLAGARALRVVVRVFWSDGPRTRRLELATVRT